MSNSDKSFRLDRQARSFRIRGFGLHDLLGLVFAFALLTFFGLMIGWLPMKLLSGKWLWIYCGFGIGFVCGAMVCSWFNNRSAKAKVLDVKNPSPNRMLDGGREL